MKRQGGKSREKETQEEKKVNETDSKHRVQKRMKEAVKANSQQREGYTT